MRGGQAHPFEHLPLRLQRASYRANNWVTTAQNWCRDSATENGRKTAKTARDAKMFDATECWEYVATVYRDILPGNLEWIAIHWQMLESAQNWSPNGAWNSYSIKHDIKTYKLQFHRSSRCNTNVPQFLILYSSLHTKFVSSWEAVFTFNWPLEDIREKYPMKSCLLTPKIGNSARWNNRGTDLQTL